MPDTAARPPLSRGLVQMDVSAALKRLTALHGARPWSRQDVATAADVIAATVVERHGEQVTEVTHECPSEGSGRTPCCDRTPFELPPYHRMTDDLELVTCGR